MKYNSDGLIEQYNTQLLIRGDEQIKGFDYHETFTLVAKMVRLRCLLSVAAAKGWELHQIDMHNAFLHGDLEEEVFMKMSPSFKFSDAHKVYRLRESFYGHNNGFPSCLRNCLSMDLFSHMLIILCLPITKKVSTWLC